MFQYLNGEALVRKSFRERRQLLKEHFKEVEGEFLFAKSAEFSSIDGVQEVLDESVKGKNPKSLLIISLRFYNVFKTFKKFLSKSKSNKAVYIGGFYVKTQLHSTRVFSLIRFFFQLPFPARRVQCFQL